MVSGSTSVSGSGNRYVSRWERLLVLVAVLVLGVVLFLVNLGGRPLLGWDEAIYASQARNMVETGSLTGFFSWPGDPAGPGLFLEKPPLFPFLQALSMLVFGFSEFAARLPSAIATVLLSGAVLLWAWRFFDWRVGLVGAVNLLLSAPLLHHSHGGRFGVPDPVFVALGSCAILLLWSAVRWERASLLYWSVCLAGFAALTKGPAVIVFGLVAIPLFVQAWTVFDGRSLWGATGLFALLVVPWHVYAFLSYPSRFIDAYVLEQTVYRAVGAFEAGTPDGLLPFMDYPYLAFLPDYFIASRYVIALGIVAVFATWFVASRDRRDVNDLFLVWWFLVPVWFFAVAGNQPWYLLPCVVPAALLVGRLASRVVSVVSAVVGLRKAVFLNVVLVGCVVAAAVFVPGKYGWPGMASNEQSLEQKRYASRCVAAGGVSVNVGKGSMDGNVFPLEFYMPGQNSVHVVSGEGYTCLDPDGDAISFADWYDGELAVS